MDIVALEAVRSGAPLATDQGRANITHSAQSESHSVQQPPLGIRVSDAARLDLVAALTARNPVSPPLAGFSSTVDRIRDAFALLQSDHKLQPAIGLAGRGSASASVPSPDTLASAMREALRIQTEVFKLSVGFHAGLSASQQSQSGVKTLVEKS